MTTTPTEAATMLREQLVEVLDAIHAHFVDKIGPAISAAINLRDFEPGRRLIADVDCITDAVDATRFAKTAPDTHSMVHFDDGICGAIYELTDIHPVNAVLDDLDPKRLANDEQNIAKLRAAGCWSDADVAEAAAERAETVARYEHGTVLIAAAEGDQS